MILVTGCAGFIGFHLTQKLLNLGHHVAGFDNLNHYYDPLLKQHRIEELQKSPNNYLLKFYHADLCSKESLNQVFSENNVTHVIHLAAQAGVRYSLDNPEAYVSSNLVGFANILEACRKHQIKHFVFASSSSVYGANQKMPFHIDDPVDHPLNLYAATKKSNELMAHSYSHLFKIPTTGFRFFTVYGPWGRPDMAYYSFTEAIEEGKDILLYNGGELHRDFTYIDDVVDVLTKTIQTVPSHSADAQLLQVPSKSTAPFRLYNLGNREPVKVLHMVEILEKLLGKRAKIKSAEMRKEDVVSTFADVTELENVFGKIKHTSLHAGLSFFVSWYRTYKTSHKP